MKIFKRIMVFLVICSCQNNAIVMSEKIEMKIDSNIVYFNNNIDAIYYNIPATTGVQSYFKLTATDNVSNSFMIFKLFSFSNPVSAQTLPSSGTVPIPESNYLKAFGLDIDDGNPANNLVYNLTDFGLVGEQIKATISGTYYDSSNMQHALRITIDVTRDQ
ncbi:hypothetical protein [Tenacibaculum sp. UWU-22]|uniref:hypothetical protein n=1 Tax=Tenacibaculum sp. UWU-22 TaxID=3234187 RepID=UPI0034DB54B6